MPEAAKSDVVRIWVGYNVVFALKANRSVVGWGQWYAENGADVQLSTFPAALQGLPLLSIVNGGYHNLALLQNGTVYAWGYNGTCATDLICDSLANILSPAFLQLAPSSKPFPPIYPRHVC